MSYEGSEESRHHPLLNEDPSRVFFKRENNFHLNGIFGFGGKPLRRISTKIPSAVSLSETEISIRPSLVGMGRMPPRYFAAGAQDSYSLKATGILLQNGVAGAGGNPPIPFPSTTHPRFL